MALAGVALVGATAAVGASSIIKSNSAAASIHDTQTRKLNPKIPIDDTLDETTDTTDDLDSSREKDPWF